MNCNSFTIFRNSVSSPESALREKEFPSESVSSIVSNLSGQGHGPKREKERDGFVSVEMAF